MPIPRLTRERTALLVVDLQPRMLAGIDGGDAVLAQCGKLIRGCAALGVPIIATEQNPDKLGPTDETIRSLLAEAGHGAERIESKMKFSACVESVRQRLAATRCTNVIICGIESHVCVMQSVIDAMRMGLLAGFVGDAIGSRRRADHELAIRRMQAAGAMPLSVEMALLEMVGDAAAESFRRILAIIK